MMYACLLHPPHNAGPEELVLDSIVVVVVFAVVFADMFVELLHYPSRGRQALSGPAAHSHRG